MAWDQKKKNNYGFRTEFVDESKEKFVNPYSFVPVDLKSKSNKQLETEEEKITGYLECELQTRTPLANPDANERIEDQEVKGHFIYPTMSIDEKPIILGSSIRGVVRNIYEIITDSCFVTTREDIITRRNKEALKPCVLERDDSNNTWNVYEAERYLFAVDGKGYRRYDRNEVYTVKKEDLKKFKSGQEVLIVPSDIPFKKNGFTVGYLIKNIKAYKDSKKENEKTGYINIGEEFSRKHFESVFVKKNRINIDQEKIQKALNVLDKIHKLYNDKTVNKSLKNVFYGNYKNEVRNGRITAWYIIENGDLKLSLANLGRVAFSKNTFDILGKKRPCNDRDDLCKACALFGMTGEESVGSFVRFTDALPVNGVSMVNNGKAVTLSELAGPKISYLPFYLKPKQDNLLPKDEWNYDSKSVLIKGRKMYWHHPFIMKKVLKTNRNSSISLIDKDNCFIFKVFFNNITQEQLKELKWSLTFGDNSNMDLCHKMGHGKPLGLGSVKIMIKKQVIRDDSVEYVLSPDETVRIDDVPMNETVKNSLLKISDLHSMDGKNVEYPSVISDDPEIKTASYQWFTSNYKFGGAPQKTLPEIMDNDLELNKKRAVKKPK